MNITAIILTAVVVGAVGLIVGFLLVTAGEKFKVEVDEKAVAVRAELPGNNCGGCGFPGCDGLAAAIAKGEAPVDGCPVGGAAVAAKIAEVMGQEAGEVVKKVAFVKCSGTCDLAKDKGEYFGTLDCRAATATPGGGAKACSYGCKGLGTCVRACQFDAIHIENGIAVVDKNKCVACGKCASVCPNHLIDIVPASYTYMVECSSLDRGLDVKKVCATGCIGCTLCTKQCESDAIHMNGLVAVIDPEKCIGCGKCAEKCPAHVIHKR